LLTIRKSHIMSWLQCPYRYKLEFIDGLKPEIDIIEAEIGRYFHDFAAMFFEELDYETLYTYDNYADVIGLFSLFLEPTMPKLVRPLCENFIGMEARRYLVLKQSGFQHLFKPFEVELELAEVRLTNNIELQGHIDRIDNIVPNQLCVIEYKTHKTFQFPRFELGFYSVLLHHHKRYKTPIKIAMYNPRLNIWKFEDVTERLLRTVRRHILSFANALKQNIFEKIKTDQCRFCFFLKTCYWGEQS